MGIPRAGSPTSRDPLPLEEPQNLFMYVMFPRGGVWPEMGRGGACRISPWRSALTTDCRATALRKPKHKQPTLAFWPLLLHWSRVHLTMFGAHGLNWPSRTVRSGTRSVMARVSHKTRNRRKRVSLPKSRHDNTARNARIAIIAVPEVNCCHYWVRTSILKSEPIFGAVRAIVWWRDFGH